MVMGWHIDAGNQTPGYLQEESVIFTTDMFLSPVLTLMSCPKNGDREADIYLNHVHYHNFFKDKG